MPNLYLEPGGNGTPDRLSGLGFHPPVAHAHQVGSGRAEESVVQNVSSSLGRIDARDVVRLDRPVQARTKSGRTAVPAPAILRRRHGLVV